MQQPVVKVHPLNAEHSQQLLLSLSYQHPATKRKLHQNYSALLLTSLILAFFFILNWAPQW